MEEVLVFTFLIIIFIITLGIVYAIVDLISNWICKVNAENRVVKLGYDFNEVVSYCDFEGIYLESFLNSKKIQKLYEEWNKI